MGRPLLKRSFLWYLAPMEEIAEFFSTPFGMLLLTTGVPVLFWLIYTLAKNYKDSQDHFDL
ncbi:hypothetical protein [Aureisphaera sp.]